MAEKNIGQNENQSGVQVERDTRKAKGYSKRVIAYSIAGLFVLIALIASQAHFGVPNVIQTQEKSLRAPQEADFAILAASIRSDRASRPVVPAPSNVAAVSPVKEPDARVAGTFPFAVSVQSGGRSGGGTVTDYEGAGAHS
ncbi:hypothetical protein FACS1894167_14880 [Synergistales bacterium]|nr:hypothetical protein FACS1894167_14880 [Synergistales bacterium]